MKSTDNNNNNIMDENKTKERESEKKMGENCRIQ